MGGFNEMTQERKCKVPTFQILIFTCNSCQLDSNLKATECVGCEMRSMEGSSAGHFAFPPSVSFLFFNETQKNCVCIAFISLAVMDKNTSKLNERQ